MSVCGKTADPLEELDLEYIVCKCPLVAVYWHLTIEYYRLKLTRRAE